MSSCKTAHGVQCIVVVEEVGVGEVCGACTTSQDACRCIGGGQTPEGVVKGLPGPDAIQWVGTLEFQWRITGQ